jgi:hypothetical protein
MEEGLFGRREIWKSSWSFSGMRYGEILKQVPFFREAPEITAVNVRGNLRDEFDRRSKSFQARSVSMRICVSRRPNFLRKSGISDRK